jgi:hypothetical protein
MRNSAVGCLWIKAHIRSNFLVAQVAEMRIAEQVADLPTSAYRLKINSTKCTCTMQTFQLSNLLSILSAYPKARFKVRPHPDIRMQGAKIQCSNIKTLFWHAFKNRHRIATPTVDASVGKVYWKKPKILI